MNIEWLPVAARNCEQQLDYLAERNPRAAVKMGDAIEFGVGQVADHPQLCRPGRVGGTRELVVSGSPYVIAYRIEPAAVVILRLVARQPEMAADPLNRHGGLGIKPRPSIPRPP